MLPPETIKLTSSKSNPAEAVFLEDRDIVLMPLGKSDVSESYLGWLNDPEILRYRAPKAFPTTMAQLASWVESLPGRGDLVRQRQRRLRRARCCGRIPLAVFPPVRDRTVTIL